MVKNEFANKVRFASLWDIKIRNITISPLYLGFCSSESCSLYFIQCMGHQPMAVKLHVACGVTRGQLL